MLINCVLSIAQKKQSSFDGSEIIKNWNDKHWAMHSSSNQQIYLRALADLVVQKLVDNSRVGGNSHDEEQRMFIFKADCLEKA